ncbi:MAG: hypothetical protein FJZ64_04420, partial [Chlamydiae bacterium]|nr:hypothetical protein [Chlamydiota bacterium]
PDESLETFPKEQILASSYSPQKIQETASFLKPEECVILCLGSPELTHVNPDRTEKWFGAEYAIRPISSESFHKWKSLSLHPDIKLPDPNPFIATDLGFIESNLQEKSPILISQNEFGIAYFSRSSEFKNPEAALRLHILSPELKNGAKSEVMGALFASHFYDLLHPTLAAAGEAGLSTSLDLSNQRLNLTLSGFSEKAPLLLREILRSFPLPSPTKAKFDLYITSLQKDLANAEKDLPLYQAKDLLDSLINHDKITKKEKLAALKTISYEDFLSFQENLFEKTYVDAFFAGNLSLKEAESTWLDVIHVLGKAPFPKEEHPKTKVATFPEGPLFITETTSAQGNATLLAIDEGTFSLPKRAAQEILGLSLKEAFFNELRSKQKTGYIAVAEDQEIEERLFQFFLVESNSHEPEDLLYRFELFLEEFLEDFQNKVPKERFAKLQEAAVNRIKNRLCNLRDTSSLQDLLAFHYRADFQFLEKRMNAIRALPYEDFCQNAKEFLSRTNKKRLAILYKGRLPSSFVYETTTAGELSEIATYTAKSERLEDGRKEIQK